jgi:hypothetical protein
VYTRSAQLPGWLFLLSTGASKVTTIASTHAATWNFSEGLECAVRVPLNGDPESRQCDGPGSPCNDVNLEPAHALDLTLHDCSQFGPLRR